MILDQTVAFRTRLGEGHRQAIAEIPGVNPWTPGVVTCPYNAQAIVQGVLESWGAPFERPILPADPIDVSLEYLEHVAVTRSEAHDWLWLNDKTRVPTSGFALAGYQRDVIAFGTGRGSANYWLPPGAGKTICALVSALVQPGPILIVAPANVRDTQYREIVRCTSATPFVLKPVAERRVKDTWQDLDSYLIESERSGFRPVLVVGWSQITDALADLVSVPWRSVIWDEAHMAKAPKREKWIQDENGRPRARKLHNRVSSAYELGLRIPRRFSTTATPVRNRMIDLWMQLTLVEPAAWGRTSSRFAFRYCSASAGEYGGLVYGKPSNLPELRERLRHSTIIVPHGVTHAELPEKRRQVIRVPPETQVKRLARSKADVEREKAQARRDGGTETKRLDSASAKRGAVKDLVIEHLGTGKGKILLFTGRHRDCDQLGEELARRTKAQVWVADGRTPIEERKAIQDAYMAHPGPCLLVGTYQAWGTGLNLQDTDVILWAMLPETPGEVDQGEGRGHRRGVLRPVLVVYTVAVDTYDEEVAERLLSKLPAVDAIVGAGSTTGLADSLQGFDRREEILATMASIFGDDEEGWV